MICIWFMLVSHESFFWFVLYWLYNVSNAKPSRLYFIQCPCPVHILVFKLWCQPPPRADWWQSYFRILVCFLSCFLYSCSYSLTCHLPGSTSKQFCEDYVEMLVYVSSFWGLMWMFFFLFIYQLFTYDEDPPSLAALEIKYM